MDWMEWVMVAAAVGMVADAVRRARQISRAARFYRRRAHRPLVLSVLYPDPWLGKP